MNRLVSLLVIGFTFTIGLSYGYYDLDTLQQDFIIETKKLDIPGYPDAFNPSIMRWDDRLLLTFRIRDPITKSTDQMGLIWLDADFNPEGGTYVLERRGENALQPSMAQDPRLVTVGGAHYIVYNNMMNIGTTQIRRMIVAPLNFDGECFFVDTYEKIVSFEGQSEKTNEKNWVPFDYEGTFLFSYFINPHVIFQPIFGTGESTTFAISDKTVNFQWGEVRGGTTALLDGDKYIGFFHSNKYLKTIQSEGKELLHYFMGAYTFSAAPPFELLAISGEPIVHKSFYNGPMYKTWKPLRVVFPCGFVFDEKYYWVSYGRQDFEAWIVKIDKEALLKTLIPL